MNYGPPRFQGDVLIRKVLDPIDTSKMTPVARDAQGRLVLAQGEATGHHHAIIEPTAILLEDPTTGDRYLVVSETGAILAHEEHASHSLGAGTYRVGNDGITTQREYTPEAIRNVAD